MLKQWNDDLNEDGSHPNDDEPFQQSSDDDDQAPVLPGPHQVLVNIRHAKQRVTEYGNVVDANKEDITGVKTALRFLQKASIESNPSTFTLVADDFVRHLESILGEGQDRLEQMKKDLEAALYARAVWEHTAKSNFGVLKELKG